MLPLLYFYPYITCGCGVGTAEVMQMSSWQQRLMQAVMVGRESAIVKIDDEKKVIEIRPDVGVEIIREIEATIRSVGIDYQIKQLT
jgi:hypothetical protein